MPGWSAVPAVAVTSASAVRELRNQLDVCRGKRLRPEPLSVTFAGLDIAEHGMYGYPEQFIPASELEGYGATPAARPSDPAGAYSTRGQEVPAT